MNKNPNYWCSNSTIFPNTNLIFCTLIPLILLSTPELLLLFNISVPTKTEILI